MMQRGGIEAESERIAEMNDLNRVCIVALWFCCTDFVKLISGGIS